MMIKIVVVDGGKVPQYMTEGAACADCFSRLPTAYVVIPKDCRCLINLGFKIELPKGYEAVIRPRSGLSKVGLDIATGTIDSDYRGEVKALVINNTGGDYTVNNLDRICQMKIQKAEKHVFEIVNELSDSDRGSNGFGSTGLSSNK